MLQVNGLTGFGAVSQDFMDCMAEHSDLEMCRTLYPETIEMDAPLCSVAQVGQQCIPDDQATAQAGTTPTSELPNVCSTCNSSFQWCDGTKCINFTQAEQIAWAQQWVKASTSGTPPAGTVATSATPSGGFFSSPIVLAGLAILGGTAGWFAYKRMKRAPKA